MTEPSRGPDGQRSQNHLTAALGSPRTIVLFGASIVLVAIIVAATRVGMSVADIQSRIAVIEQFSKGEGNPDIALLRSNTAAIRGDLSVIRTDAGWLLPMSPLLGWLPQVGGDVSAAGDLFNMADALVRAGDTVLTGLPATAADNIPEGSAGTAKLLSALADARPQLERARNYLDSASYYRARIDPALLSTRSAALLDRVDRIMPLADLAASASLALPDLLGADGARTYLIIAQNEDERRATGGFVSAAGLAVFEHGALTSMEFMDSYQVDDLTREYPPPPAALEKYMLAGYWLFRDANWSPDFPTSARQLAAFYEAGKGRHLDGVIALDQETVRLLVKATGPFDIPGSPPIHVTADSVLSVMRDSWSSAVNAPLSQEFSARKNFIGKMAKALQARLLEGDRSSAAGLARGIYAALRTRHLMAYLPHSSLAKPLERIGWDGAIHSASGDYVMVVDSNLGFNKADALVNRQYRYEVSIDSNANAHSTLSIHYHHAGSRASQECAQQVPDDLPGTTYESLMNECYWDYLRLFVPFGATLNDASRFPISATRMLNGKDSTGDPESLASENGRGGFATFFVLERGEDKDVHFTYAPPRESVVQSRELWTYKLYWQKQPGAAAIQTQVTVTLPQGSNITRATAPATATATTAASANGVRLNYSVVLDADIEFEIQFRRH